MAPSPRANDWRRFEPIGTPTSSWPLPRQCTAPWRRAQSEGQFDENGTGPADASRSFFAGPTALQGRYHYDATDPKFTTGRHWKHRADMKVGETYEVLTGPTSNMGACGTLNQYQTPFYDGVFCALKAGGRRGRHVHATARTSEARGHHRRSVSSREIFTHANDETSCWPRPHARVDIVEGTRGTEITGYTGSTTGMTRNNEVRSVRPHRLQHRPD